MTFIRPMQLAICAVLFSGCTSTIPVISPAIECPVKEADLARKCAPPATIPSGITYHELTLIMVEDRKNLEACEQNRAFLQDALNTCNAEIRKHNESIEEVNKKYTGKQ